MFDNYIIEIRQPSVGIVLKAEIVVRDGSRFQFFAASHVFDALDGRYFPIQERRSTPRSGWWRKLRPVGYRRKLAGTEAYR